MKNTTKQIFTIVFAFLMQICFAHPITSSISARQTSIALDNVEWFNPYIIEGMVEWWDAEWNAGPGIHDPSTPYLVSLAENGSVAEMGIASKLKRKSIDCSNGGGVIASECSYVTKDNRNLTRPITIVLCMRFYQYKVNSRIIRLGLTGDDTTMYSVDNYNLRWARGGPLLDISSISPDDNILVTIAHVYDISTTSYYCNGNMLSTSRAYWCIGGGISFLCDAVFDLRTANAEFFNAMVFDRALSNDELDYIHNVNIERYGN